MTAFRSALVTGASGFIGSVLVNRLLAEKIEVTCLVRCKQRLKGLPVNSGIRIVEAPSFDAEYPPMKQATGVYVVLNDLQSENCHYLGANQRCRVQLSYCVDGAGRAGLID